MSKVPYPASAVPALNVGDSGTSIKIGLNTIRHNTRKLVDLCSQNGVTLTGVTKATFGAPQVAKAMLEGGVTSLGESRLENIQRLQLGGIQAPIMMLRLPSLSNVKEVVARTDISLNSEISVIQALSDAAIKQKRIHEVILMVDLGDLREGVFPKDLEPLAEQAADLPGIQVAGVGTNLTCFGGVLPTEENLGQLVDCAERIAGKRGIDIKYVSGGNSSSLPILLSGKLPQAVNHLRIGEGILLGRETARSTQWPGARQDAFTLSSELLEIKDKPSVPTGTTSMNAFGEQPVFEDRGIVRRGILNLGRADLDTMNIWPINPDISVLGASSDHLIVDLSKLKTQPHIGDRIAFRLSYSALVGAMSSNAIDRQFVDDAENDGATAQC